MDWKKLLSGVEEQSLDFYPPIFQDGSPVVQPSATVFDDGIVDWKLALFGKFIGSAPNFSAMKKIIEILWGKSSTVKVSLASQDLYVFSFSSVTDRDWVLENEAPVTKVWKKKAVPEVGEPYLQRVAVVQCSTVCREPSLISDEHVAPKQDDVSAEKLPSS
ncbi:hypothetical protein V6N13_123864 [Hibiscus sabdariffa]